MLLTLKPSPPAQNGIKANGPPEYSIVSQSVASMDEFSSSALFRQQQQQQQQQASHATTNTTPAGAGAGASPAMDSSARANTNTRTLPNPSNRTLPPLPPPPLYATSHELPPPPTPPARWQFDGNNTTTSTAPGTETSMQIWLQAKVEEDRKKQEEDKARQEMLRLEQRMIEHNMLRDALQAGVPPHMVPLIFTSISGAGNGLPQSVFEWMQQYISHYSPAQHGHVQAQAQVVPAAMPPPPGPGLELGPPPPQRYGQPGVPADLRRNSHTVYTAQPTVPPPSETLPSQPLSVPEGSSPARQPLEHPSFLPGGSMHRMRGNEIQTQHPPINLNNTQYAPGSSAPPPSQPPPPSSSTKDYQYRPRQSTSIYFHHWVPPGQQAQSGGKPSQESSSHSHSHSYPEYHHSPGRRRKTQGSHQPASAPAPAPIPSSRSRQSSPTGSRAGSGRKPHQGRHRRQQSSITSTITATPEITHESEDTTTSSDSRNQAPKVENTSTRDSPSRHYESTMPPLESHDSDGAHKSNNRKGHRKRRSVVGGSGGGESQQKRRRHSLDFDGVS